MSRTRTTRAGLTLTGGLAAAQVLAFVRNAGVARLIGVEQFGIAATLLIVVMLVEMLSNFNLDKLLLQAPDGDEPVVQDTIHTVQAVRGVLTAVVLIGLAWPFAWLFSVPDAWPAFMLLAAVPLGRSFIHLDVKRVQRALDFRPEVAAEVTSQVVSLVVGLAAAWWWRNFWAVPVALSAQVLVYVGLSFATSKRPYRWAWDRDFARRCLTFGWPLLLNGLLMFVILQGDRAIIASVGQLLGTTGYTLADVGIYSAAATLMMAPSLLLSRISSSFLLPVFSKAQSDPAALRRQYRLAMQGLGAAAVAMTVFVVVGGNWIMPLVYGGDFAAAGTFVGWLAAAHSLRLVRSAPTLAALSRADSHNLLLANIARVSAVGLTFAAAAVGTSLTVIAATAFAGEVVALLASTVLLARRHDLPASATLVPTVRITVIAGLASLIGLWANGRLPPVAAVGAAVLLAIISTIVAVVLSPQLREKLPALLPMRGVGASTGNIAP